MTFTWWPIAIIGFIGIILCLLFSGFDFEDHHHMHAEFIRQTEASVGRLQG
jgi:cytochrome aa3-600 menaquinol oxidase subunit 1